MSVVDVEDSEVIRLSNSGRGSNSTASTARLPAIVEEDANLNLADGDPPPLPVSDRPTQSPVGVGDDVHRESPDSDSEDDEDYHDERGLIRVPLPARVTLRTRTLLFLFTLTAVVVTALVSGLPIYLTSRRVSRDLVVNLHSEISDYIHSDLSRYLDESVGAWQALKTSASHVNSTTNMTVYTSLCTVAQSNSQLRTVYFADGPSGFKACQRRFGGALSVISQPFGNGVLYQLEFEVLRKNNSAADDPHAWECFRSNCTAKNLYDPTQRPWWAIMRNQSPSWVPLYRDNDNNEPVASFGGYVEQADGVYAVDVTNCFFEQYFARSLTRVSQGMGIAYEDRRDAGTANLFSRAQGSQEASECYDASGVQTGSGVEVVDVTNLSSLDGMPYPETILDAHRRNFVGTWEEGSWVFMRKCDKDATDHTLFPACLVSVSNREEPLSEWTRDANLTIVIFCVSALTLAIIILLVGNGLFVAPLERLSASMIRQSVFVSKHGEDPHSRVFEIYEAEHAFNFLCEETQKLKKFAPQVDLDGGGASPSAMTTLHSHNSITVDGGSNLNSIGPHGGAAPTKDPSVNPLGQAAAATNYNGTIRSIRLNTSRNLSLRQVSVVALSIHGLHRTTHEMVASLEFLDLKYSAIIEQVCRTSARFRGHLDLFYGDLIFLSFNSVHKQSQHRKASTRTAMTLHKEIGEMFGETDGISGILAGVATGQAVVGNMGTDEVARFSVLGDVTRVAMTLRNQCENFNRAGLRLAASANQKNPERIPQAAKHSNFNVVVNEDVLTEVSGEMHYQRLGIVSVPHFSEASHAFRAVHVAAIMADPLSNVESHDEWMYMLRKVQAEDPYVDLNEALATLVNRRGELHPNASQILDAIPQPWMFPLAIQRYRALVRVSNSRLGSLSNVPSGMTTPRSATSEM